MAIKRGDTVQAFMGKARVDRAWDSKVARARLIEVTYLDGVFKGRAASMTTSVVELVEKAPRGRTFKRELPGDEA